MKKNLWLAALVGVALTGCVNEEVSPEAKQKEVLSFSAPVMATQSRANVMGEINGVKYDANEHFKVFCKSYKNSFKGWNTSDDISHYFNANGETAKSGLTVGQGNYWATDVVHYWPEVEYNLAFGAYSPAEFGSAASNTQISYTGNGLKLVGFKTEENSNLQYDLMYSSRIYDLNKSEYSNKSVPLVFKHALSSIVFSSQKSSTDVNYEITKLEIVGLFAEEGDFSQGIKETIGTDNKYVETEAPGWENLSYVSQNRTYTPTFTSFQVPVESPKQFTSGTSSLLLIPQSIPEEAYVKVYYTKTTNPGSANEKKLATSATIKLKDFSYTHNNQTIKVDKWDMGKRYVYRIAFGQNTRIYFEPSTVDWVQEPTLIYTIQ